MAYYTDYTETVLYNTTDKITNSAVSNVIADMLVAHAECTLVSHANTAVASSSSNPAIVTYKNMFTITVYGNSTLGNVTVLISFTSGHTGTVNITLAFPAQSSIHATIALRFYNCKSGILVYAGTTSGWLPMMHSLKLWDIAGEQEVFGMGTSEPGYSVLYDDSKITNGTYAVLSSTYSGVAHADSAKQILNTSWLTTASGRAAGVRYKIIDGYISSLYLATGIVSIGTRIFYIASSAAVAVELNS